METTSLDSFLLTNGVAFLPWVGKGYEYGFDYNNDGTLLLGSSENKRKKVLVLGESHYAGEGVNFFNPNNSEWNVFTRNCVNNFIKRASWDKWMNTYTKFERSIVNKEIDANDSEKIWEHLAFYNYIQVPLYESRMKADDKDYQKAELPFFKVLSVLLPDIVIVWGDRLYQKIPGDFRNMGFEGMDGPKINIDGIDYGTWIYNYKNQRILLMEVYHPSSGYSWPFWNKVIKYGFELARIPINEKKMNRKSVGNDSPNEILSEAVKNIESTAALIGAQDAIGAYLRKEYLFKPLKQYADDQSLSFDVDKKYCRLIFSKKDWKGSIGIFSDYANKPNWRSMYIGINYGEEREPSTKLDCFNEPSISWWPHGRGFLPSPFNDLNSAACYVAVKNGDVALWIKNKVNEIIDEATKKGFL